MCDIVHLFVEIEYNRLEQIVITDNKIGICVMYLSLSDLVYRK